MFKQLKDRGVSNNWPVYHVGNTSAPETESLFLNKNQATLDLLYWNDTSPSSTVFTLGANLIVNDSGHNFIAYCFHSVEGYSKLGSYTGNGSTDGTFVHCGFRPAWFMVKRTDTANNWVIYDNKRSPRNNVHTQLFADLNNAEASAGSTLGMDFLSNGIKMRGGGNSYNASGGTYIFMAFAEAPFKNANAR